MPSEGYDSVLFSLYFSMCVSVFAAARAPEMEDLWKDEPTGNQFHGFYVPLEDLKNCTP